MTKILLFDDEEHIRFLYSEYFTEEGYDIVTSDTYINGLESIEEEQPDIALLDVIMSDGYGGLDFLLEIKNEFPKLPAGLVTAYDIHKDDMRHSKADFYWIKSFDLTGLRNNVEMALKEGPTKEKIYRAETFNPQ